MVATLLQGYSKERIKNLESDLKIAATDYGRISILDELIAIYMFVDVPRAHHYLLAMKPLLDIQSNGDYHTHYYLNLGFVSNQLDEYENAHTTYQEGIRLLLDHGTPHQLAAAYIDLIGVLINLNAMDQARVYLQKAARLLDNYPNPCLYARLICREAFVFLHEENLPASLESLLDSKKRFLEHLSKTTYADIYYLQIVNYGLGEVYLINEDHELALQAFDEAHRQAEQFQITHRFPWHYYKLGSVLLLLNREEQATQYFNKVLNMPDTYNRKARLGVVSNLVIHYLNEDDPQTAFHFVKAMENIIKEDKNNDGDTLARLELQKARVYIALDQSKKAEPCIVAANDNIQLSENWALMAQIYQTTADSLAQKGDFESGFAYMIKVLEAKDKYADDLRSRELSDLTLKYEAERKRQETEMLRRQASELQLRTLQSQMNPHFMYNALNAIQSYITSNETSVAAEGLADFATLVRKTLNKSEQAFTILDDEASFLEEYLKINKQLRFRDKLSYSVSVDDDIEDDYIKVPTMLIQPFVENALEHGIRSKEKGFIHIRFTSIDEDTLLVIVEDDGIGRAEAALNKMNGGFKHASKGINITEERLRILELMSGKPFHFRYIDKVDERGKGTGTRVEITVSILDEF